MKTRAISLVLSGCVAIAACALACGGESSSEGAGTAGGGGGGSGSEGSTPASSGGQPGSLCASSADFASCQACCRTREPLGATYFDLLRSCKCVACVVECSSTLCGEPATPANAACQKCLESETESCAVAAQGCASRPECTAIVSCEAQECAASK